MDELDPLQTLPNPPDASSGTTNASSSQGVAASQIVPDDSAETERLLSDLCGIKKPVASEIAHLPIRPAINK